MTEREREKERFIKKYFLSNESMIHRVYFEALENRYIPDMFFSFLLFLRERIKCTITSETIVNKIVLYHYAILCFQMFALARHITRPTYIYPLLLKRIGHPWKRSYVSPLYIKPYYTRADI